MSFPEALIRKRRARAPMDERLPDGRSVQDVIRPRITSLPLPPDIQQKLDRVRSEPDVPPDMYNVARGRDVGVSAPWVRISRTGDSVSIEPFDPTNRPASSATPSFRDALNRTMRTGAPQANTELTGDVGGLTRDRRTQPRDYVADDAAYLRGVQGQPRTWRDKLIDVADVVNTVAGGKPRVLKSKRERAIQQAENQLATDIELQKQSLSQMVPVTLDNGQQVMVPARQAGTLQSQQQGISQRNAALAERKATNESRKQHWDAMDSRDRKRIIVSLYNSGGLNDPDMLEYAADQLGLPGNLREKFIAGQMRDAIDEEGNIIEVNRQTGKVSKVGPKSYEVTKEAGRERRSDAAIASRERVAAMPARAQARGAAPDRATGRRAATLVGQIERARREMEAADAKGDTARRESARLMGEQAASELNALDAGYEAGPGEGGYPYYKKGAQSPQTESSGKYAGRRISTAKLPEFARRHGMTVDEARQYLTDEKAIIY